MSPTPRSPLRLHPLALATAIACSAPLSHAQTAAAARPALLDTVVVTPDAGQSYASSRVQVGAFRDQDALDVPLTNNVVPREVLDAQGARTLFEALRNTAGVTRAQLSGNTYDNIAIRGVLVDNRSNYRLNGSLPLVNLIDIPLENKERVEVLKGASSLYYGFVPPSGVVNLVTKRATKAPVTTVAVSANHHGGADAHLDVGRRFGPDGSMGLRVNAVAGHDNPGIDHVSGQRSLIALAGDWRPTPGLNLRLDVEHYQRNISEQAAIRLPAAVNGVITLPPVPPNTRNLAGSWQRYDAQATNWLLRGDVALGDDWVLTLEAGRAEAERDRRFSQFQNFDIATGDGTLNIFFQDGQTFVTDNQRAELTGLVETAGLSHELTVGVMHNRREQDTRQAPTANVPQNLYNPVDIAPIPHPGGNASNPSHVTDSGVYVLDRLRLGERWQVLAGLRHSRFESVNPNTQRYEAEKTTPNVSAIYQPMPNLSLYTSWLRGLEATGTASANHANSGEVLPPAVNTQIELGAKARPAPGLLLQAALFQLKRPSTTTDAANNFVIGGLVRSRGLEFAASGELTRNLSLIASGLLLDATIERATTAAEEGKTPENTPKRTFSLAGEYRLGAWLPGLSVNAGVFHVGPRPANNLNQAELPAYATLSAGARWRTQLAGHATTWQVNVDNLTDRDYWNTGGNGLLGVGAPRTVRLAAQIEL